MHRGLTVAALCFASAGLAAAPEAFARVEPAARPPPLEGKTGCELWTGTVSGNDPSVLVEALICEGIDGAVSGQLQWSSLTSGYSIRDISGQWSHARDRLTMSDTRIVVNKPNAGWRFCTVDQYDLALVAPTQLRGSYRSNACSDTAKVELSKKVLPAPAPSLEPEAPRAPTPSEPDAAPSEPRAAPTSGCACQSAPRSAGGQLFAGLGAIAIVARSVRRCRRRAW